jgi:hypothetical protein
MRNNVLPYPVRGLPYIVTFPILDADGDLVTGAAGPDSLVSLNGDTFAAVNPGEAVEIATASGMYYLSLTAAEMAANIVTIIVKTSTPGAKTTPLTLYPRVLSQIRAATAQTGVAGSITLDTNASARDDYYNGCIIYIHTGTGNGQVRTITDYIGSTKVASVSPDFITSPSSDSQFYIYITDIGSNPALVMGSIVDGSKDLQEVQKTSLAVLAGNVTVPDRSTYIFKDQSGETKLTEVIGPSSVDRTIS